MKRLVFLTVILLVGLLPAGARGYEVSGPEGGLAMKIALPDGFDPDRDECSMVLLMHGIFSSKDYNPMPSLAKALAKAGIASIRFDFDGHGKSEGRMQDMTIEKEIADACKAGGKKPSEVLNEHATAMYELGQYQRNLEEELNKIRANPDLSDNDVEDFCKAANALLASKGLPQMPLPSLARRGIRLKHAQRRAEKRAAKKAAEGADK